MKSSSNRALRLLSSTIQPICRNVLIRQISFNPFAPKPIEKAKDAHSNLLTDMEHVFEVQHHIFKPRALTDYENAYSDYSSAVLEKYASEGLVHTGSWKVHIGNTQDQCVHIWMYKNFKHLDELGGDFKLPSSSSDDKILKFREKYNQYLIHRSNQLCLSFSYFGIPQPRSKSDDQPGSSIYEMRSYWLKPGTLIEWGNLWHKGVQYRPDAKVLGLFSQIGQLYNVHHMWGYKNFQQRKQMRTNAWAKPGWAENVEYTVPLIRKMESKILVPLKNSPMQ